MSLSLTPLHAALKAGPARTLPVMLTYAAPDEAAPAHRAPLNVALVIDASPSMGGDPLEQAKAAALTFIDRLQPTDRLAVVAYSTEVVLLTESAPVAQVRDQARQKIAHLDVLGGGTNLHGGWLKGAQAVAPHVRAEVQTRVLLLSDGQANQGETRIPALAEQSAQLLATGIVTSTYGLGRGFNEDLMTQMAHGGGGQAFYAESADQLAGYFDIEFRLLEATVARDLQATVQASVHGVPLPAITWANPRGTGPLGTRLGDVALGSASWLLGHLQVPDLAPGLEIVLTSTLHYRDAAGAPQVATVTTRLPLGQEDAPADGQVQARVDELEAARIQREARAEAERGNWAGVDQHLNALNGLAATSQNAYIMGVSASLTSLSSAKDRAAFSKESMYAASAMTTRGVALDEDVHALNADRYGLRKAKQGSSTPTPPQA